jgi:hypothetical protein
LFLVRPDATEDEVAEALDDELIRPIFAQSVIIVTYLIYIDYNVILGFESSSRR